MIKKSITPLLVCASLTTAFAQETSVTPESQLGAQGVATEMVSDELLINMLKQEYPGFTFHTEGRGKVGSQASIAIPEGCVYLDGRDTGQLMESWGNLPAVYEGGLMSLHDSWIITFEYDGVGYVKDDEKDNLDASKLLKELQEAQEAANKERSKRGLEQLDLVGWSCPPQYNSSTNNLEWGLKLKDSQGEVVINHLTKVLGRHGVMNVTLIGNSESNAKDLKQLQEHLKEFEYNSGNKYSEFREGDKIADYGLTGLIVGGSAFVIWKFWKPIAAGVVALGIGIKKIFGRFTGGNSEGRIS